MSVRTTLNKLRKHNSAIIGGIVRAHGIAYNNLEGIYQMVNMHGLADYVEQILELTASLESDGDIFETTIIEYENHSLMIKPIESGVFILITHPLNSAGFKKMQIGVNLFMKQINLAIENNETDSKPATPPIAAESDEDESDFLEITLDETPQKKLTDVSQTEKAEVVAEVQPKKKRFYRGQEY